MHYKLLSFFTRYNHQQLYSTFSHINCYLKSAYLFLKADLLFIQDSLFCSGLNGDHRHLKENTNFLSRLARKQTPSRQNDPAEFLLSMARLRMCLDTVACILSRVIGKRTGTRNFWSDQFMAVTVYCLN